MELTKDEALNIMKGTDPRHEQYKNGSELAAAVERAFTREHPGENEIGNDLPAHLNDEAVLGKPSQPNLDKPIAKAEGTETAPAKFSAEWDYSGEQSEEALKQIWGPYRFVDNMADLQDPQNFTLVFDKFIQTPDDGRFLRELFQTVGNHPAGLRLYHHIIKLAKGEL